jgi:hypothetical protein
VLLERDTQFVKLESSCRRRLGTHPGEIGWLLNVHQSTALDYLRVAARNLKATNTVRAAVIGNALGLFTIVRRNADIDARSEPPTTLPA